MTAKAASISIIVKIGNVTKELKTTFNVDDIERGVNTAMEKIKIGLLPKILEAMDDNIREEVPKSWQNVGREERRIVLEQGYVTYSRRIYKDEKGQRHKPLDDILQVRPYARSTDRVQEMGSVLAAQTTYRMAADSLSYILKTRISPSSIQRMVWKTGGRVEEQEAASQSEEGGKIVAPVLYGESDGVWVHLQHEKEKKKEVKVAVMYSGKKAIGKGRYKLENKVVMTQFGGTTTEWQEKLRDLADRTYDLERTRLMVAGGDGNAWVKHSFDLLNLPQTYVLDRFHVVRALRQAFGRKLKISELRARLFHDGFEAIAGDLLTCIHQAKGKQKEQMKKTYKYLANHQDNLIDLDRRNYPDLSFCTLGSIEGNVDKLVVHRMQGRGCCWRSQGAGAMLAILRHKDKLQNHSFHYFPIPSAVKATRRVKPTKIQQSYQPVSGPISLFHGGDQYKPWVQSLKRKVNYGFSLNAYF